ncbi:MAG: dihydropteroate synthase [Candidatus Nitrospinota bacterium M3_3B_026]
MKPAPSRPREYRYKGLRLPFNRPLVMGIVNVTPDSFSDGGLFMEPDAAARLAEKFAEDGADILDIGGESTRPGAEPVSADDEKKRVIPVIRRIVRRLPKIPVSIDSLKPEVVREALAEGAAMINDVGGLRDPGMMELAAESGAPVVITHMKGTPRTMQRRPAYRDVVETILSFFKERTKACRKAGVEKIILDPGIGFGKTARHNLQIINRLDRITRLGYPVMVGASRKSFIGKTLGLPVDEREEATIAVNVLAVAKGASIVRVHGVKANARAVRMAWSVLKEKRP